MSTNRLLQNPGFHLVVFVDLLGQTNELERFVRARTPEEQRAAMEATVRTARQIDLVRTSLTGLIQEVASRPPSEAILAQLPNDEARESFKRFRRFDVKQIGFSDCFVTSAPLGDRNEVEGVASVAYTLYSVLLGTAAAALLAASYKIPMRGGIAIGIGGNPYDNEVYGPCLVDAYNLERKVAEYNRIVISPSVFDYLNHLEQLPQDNPFRKAASERARMCRERLICFAPDDELPMLHMLSPEVLNLPTNVPGKSWEDDGVCARAHDWARTEAQRFANERNMPMWGRYVRFLRYLDAHMPEPPSPAPES